MEIGMNCQIKLLLIFSFDCLEVLVFIRFVLCKGIWIHFLEVWWQNSKMKIIPKHLIKLFLVHFFFYRQRREGP